MTDRVTTETEEEFKDYIRQLADATVRPGVANPTIFIDKFTPRRAQLMMAWIPQDGAIRQRAVRRNHVELLKRSILQGKWCPAANTLMLGSGCELYNGQHTVVAIFESRQTVSVFIRLNCPPEVRFYANSALRQTSADALQMRNYQSSTSLSSCAKHLIAYERIGVFVPRRPLIITDDDVVDMVSRHPNLVNINIKGSFLRSLKYTNLQRALYYAAWSADPDRYENTMAQMVDGEHSPGSPIRIFLQKLIANATKKKDRLHPAEVAATFIRAWNLFFDGRQVDRLGVIDPWSPVEMLGFSREDCKRGMKAD